MNAPIASQPTAPWSGIEPGKVVLDELEVRVVLAEEQARVTELLAREHYLGRGRSVGRELVQVVHHQGRWAALLVWGPCAIKLADRDQWIGWESRQRSSRLGLIVQNRRFLVLAETRMPNLASRALGLAVRALPGHWMEHHGFRPVLAETFTDIECFEGTCYRAAGWQPCGMTKGFERHRADFYREHKRPKKLWIKPLARDAREVLCAERVPPVCEPGCTPPAQPRGLPIAKAQIETLREALRSVPDPRKGNRTWPISTLLGLVCVAMLAGRKNLAEIQRYGTQLPHKARLWLGFLPARDNPDMRRAPSYQALYNLLCQLDANALAEALNGWLSAHQDGLPRHLALDGKYVRDLVLTLGLSEHESGAPVAVTIACQQPKTQQAKTEGEITAAKRLYQNHDLQGAVITGDALHCQRESMQMVLEAGGDFLFQLKQNQPAALKMAKKLARQSPPLFAIPAPNANTGA